MKLKIIIISFYPFYHHKTEVQDPVWSTDTLLSSTPCNGKKAACSLKQGLQCPRESASWTGKWAQRCPGTSWCLYYRKICPPASDLPECLGSQLWKSLQPVPRPLPLQESWAFSSTARLCAAPHRSQSFYLCIRVILVLRTFKLDSKCSVWEHQNGLYYLLDDKQLHIIARTQSSGFFSAKSLTCLSAGQLLFQILKGACLMPAK